MNMSAFDTLAYSKRLRGAGFSEEQAEAVVEVVTQAVEGGVATKADVHEVGHAITEVRAELKQDMADLRAELKQDIAEVRSEVAEVRTELKSDTRMIIMWNVGTMIGLVGLLKLFG